MNYPEVEFDEAYRRYVLIHEFGHSLGLEHPFEAGDGDVLNGITDPWQALSGRHCDGVPQSIKRPMA